MKDVKDKISGNGLIDHKLGFAVTGKYDFPIVMKQNIYEDDIVLIGFSETGGKNKYDFATVHFFENDEKFDEVWNHPERYIEKLEKYRQVLSPDFSQYIDMPAAMQIFNVFRNRWCAAYWQREGLLVIPTISWSDETSFAYSFDAIEKGASVAVSTVGCAKCKDLFMAGFDEMLSRIEPGVVICYGDVFDAMRKNVKIIEIVYSPNEKLSRIKGR
jgi:hypothetical protein